jgi:serine/threonine-protein kinase
MTALLALPTDRSWLAAAFADDALGAQYQLVRELGSGAMGIVVLARDRALHRVVAIKLLHRELATQPDERARFQREARLMARLTHPGIVAVHTFGEIDVAGLSPRSERVPYFVMRYVDGESLAERLRRDGCLSASATRRILSDLALALDYAHHEGVVHRDLKPENVLLERAAGRDASADDVPGRALLTDFGIAALPSYDAQSQPGLSAGTPLYMSPEQLVGEHAIDGRSDLYALGVLGFTLLTGRPPFGGRTMRELSARHLLQRVPSLRARAPGAPGPLVAAIERCLAKDPEARWKSGAELHDALSRRVAIDWRRITGALRAAVI